MKIRKFHLYTADLNPQIGTEPGKVRPVVVVQSDLLNTIHPSTIVCPITTNIVPEATILRIRLLAVDTNLKRDSDILVDQILSVDNRRFIKKIGLLNDFQKKNLLQNLRIIILE